MTIIQDIYGQVRTVKEISPVQDKYIIAETYSKTGKIYSLEKNAINAARKDLRDCRSISGIIRNHWGFVRTRFN